MGYGGHIPNYVNPESRAGTVLAINIACSVVATIFVSTRLFVRIRILRSAGWDDLAAALATIMLIIISTLSSISTKYGFGKHIWDIPTEKLTPQLKLGLLVGCIYNPSIMFIKLSVLFFYLRIFSSPTFRRAVWGMIVFVVAVAIAFMMGNIFRCSPISFYWDRTIPGGSCINLQVFIYTNAALSITSDLVIWAMPIPILSRLDFNRRKKYALLFVFSLGLFACIASILRLLVLRDAGMLTDPTWTNVGINTWSQIELAAAITCACLPPLKPLIARIFRGIFDSHNGTYVSSHHNVYGLRAFPNSAIPKDSLVPKGSEEEILAHIGTGSATDIENGVIKKTVDVRVTEDRLRGGD